VHLADAQDFDLGRTFDVVFAGEIIEHLDNVHGFLSSVRRHLAPGGRFVLTTPNAFYVGNFIYRLGGNARVHPQHTAWYCESTLRRVLSVNGFPEADIEFIGHTARTPARRWRAPPSSTSCPPVCPSTPWWRSPTRAAAATPETPVTTPVIDRGVRPRCPPATAPGRS